MMLAITIWIAVGDAHASDLAGSPEDTAFVEEIVEEETEAVKRAVFEVTEDELQTVEETLPEMYSEEVSHTEYVEATSFAETIKEETEDEVETVPETASYFPIYSVDGDVLDHDLQRFMWEELNSQGIGWWMEYAMLTAYQESGFDVYDITNGKDYGLLQYRITYWEERAARYGYPGADIFNAYVQIYIYVRQTAERLRQGLSVADVISRHKQSDWGTFDQEYVNQVLGHDIEQIR